MVYQSNATVSGQARAASKMANEATAKAVDGESHQNAANKHFEAQQAQQAAGNSQQAALHRKMGNLHQSKANHQLANEQHADDLGRLADQATKKANLQDYGKDPDELRGKDELHQDAADKHQQASEAYKQAGKDRETKYHADMAQAHQEACGGSNGASGSASESDSTDDSSSGESNVGSESSE
jgi:hypothetical protein